MSVNIFTRQIVKGAAGLAYRVDPGQDILAVDRVTSEITLDEGRMAATACISSTAQDRDGDIVDQEGLDWSDYRQNPAVFFNHKVAEFPVGRSEDDGGAFTVQTTPERTLATCYFAQKSQYAQQIYALVADKTLRGTSIGFLVRKAVPLGGNEPGLAYGRMSGSEGRPKGYLIEKALVTEWSWVGVGANPEAVTIHLSKGLIGGSRIDDQLRMALEPYALERKILVPTGGIVPGAFVEKGAKDQAFERLHPRGGDKEHPGRFSSSSGSAAGGEGETNADHDRGHQRENSGAGESVSNQSGSQGLSDGSGLSGSHVGLGAPRRSGALAHHEPLAGLPRKVQIGEGRVIEAKPYEVARHTAEEYMRKAGLHYDPPKKYAKVNVGRAQRIADAYAQMKHDPNDPEVKAAYKAMIDETVAQWQAIKKTGLKCEFVPKGAEDPYQGKPRLSTEDVRENNHLWVFATDDGFGSSKDFDASKNPLLGDSGEVVGGKKCCYNDIFRIVHDYFGHIKEGVGFRADGEENAWRSHSSMYSPLARRAMTSETRGQNSWVNFGPHGEHNKTATPETTIFADQKVGLLPEWVVHEGAGDEGAETPKAKGLQFVDWWEEEVYDEGAGIVKELDALGNVNRFETVAPEKWVPNNRWGDPGRVLGHGADRNSIASGDFDWDAPRRKMLAAFGRCLTKIFPFVGMVRKDLSSPAGRPERASGKAADKKPAEKKKPSKSKKKPAAPKVAGPRFGSQWSHEDEQKHPRDENGRFATAPGVSHEEAQADPSKRQRWEPVQGASHEDAMENPLKRAYFHAQGVENDNVAGLYPNLRNMANLSEEELKGTKEFKIGLKTNNKNAAEHLESLAKLREKFPNAADSVEGWNRMQAHMYGSNDVPVAPFNLIKSLGKDGDGLTNQLSKLKPGQIKDADLGFKHAKEFRELYTSGKASIATTGKLLMWSILSRGVSPFTQESLFIDAFAGSAKWIDKAAKGEFTRDDIVGPVKLTKSGKPVRAFDKDKKQWFDVHEDGEYIKWAKSCATKGSGVPGAGATHNLTAFGKNLLMKLGQKDEDGKTRLEKFHNMLCDPKMTGREIRREFMKFGAGVGIDNKVVSFTLLVTGFDDVMVLDRVQMRNLWDDGRFKEYNLYDGVKKKPADEDGEDDEVDEEGKKKGVVTGSAINSLGNGVRGLALYEAIEDALSAKLKGVYKALGREDAASIGRYHWESWVATSEQEASHQTLEAILKDAGGDDEAIGKVCAKQGEYGAYQYGAGYRRKMTKDAEGNPVGGEAFVDWTVPGASPKEPSGEQPITFTIPRWRRFLAEMKKDKSGVFDKEKIANHDKKTGATLGATKDENGKDVYQTFKVSMPPKEHKDSPWYYRPEVRRDVLIDLARRCASEQEETKASKGRGKAKPKPKSARPKASGGTRGGRGRRAPQKDPVQKGWFALRQRLIAGPNYFTKMLAAFDHAVSRSKALSCGSLDALIQPPNPLSSVLPSMPQPDQTVSFKIPASVSEAARVALEAHQSSGCNCSVDALRMGLKLAKGGQISLAEIAELKNYFAETTRKPRSDSQDGTIEWDLRGGSNGLEWSRWITETIVWPRGAAQGKDECIIATKEASCGQV